MTTTVNTWTASCQTCREPMTGRDVIEPSKELDREHGHDNPAFTFMTDIKGGAHSSWPDESTIRIIKTSTY